MKKGAGNMMMNNTSWQNDRDWRLFYCGKKRIGYVKVTTDIIMPFSWCNYLTNENGQCVNEDEAKESLEHSFNKLIKQLTTENEQD